MNKTLILILLVIACAIRESCQKEHHHHHRHHHNQRSFNNETAKKRTAISIDYNLQRDYIAATVGKDVQLDCKMKNLANEDDKIVWLKMPKGEVLTLNGNRVTPDQRVNSKCIQNMTPCWSLVITEVRESDTGFYVCQTNAMQTKYIYLDIMVPPKLLTNYPVDKIDVSQNSNTSLTCEFYGKPEPLIKWFKYHNAVPKEIEKFRGHKTINLFIHKESPSEYECVADNSIPPIISKKIFLNIQYAPTVKFLNSRIFQTRGERVIFDCIVHSNPKSKISWFKNQTKLVESNKYTFEELDNNLYRLYINNLTDSDFDDYYVGAVNHVGKANAKVELVQLPSIILNDLSDSFTSSSSTPKPDNDITTTSSAASYNSNNLKNNKNLRNSLNKVNEQSDTSQPKVFNYDESVPETEFVFFKTTSSINLLKANKSTKSSSYRSNKHNHNNNNNNNNNTQTNLIRIKSSRKQSQQALSSEHIEPTTSTIRNNLFDIESKATSLVFSFKFHTIFIMIVSILILKMN